MKTIIVPVNFSASSDNAARYAVDMAVAIHADLHLIHFVQIQAAMSDVPLAGYALQELQESGEEALRQLREALIKRTECKVNILTWLEVGPVENRIEEYCAKYMPFVVIMGNAGKSLERALAGSNVSKAIHHLPHPMIVVPEKAIFLPIKKIVLACDLDDIAEGVPVSVSFLKEFRDIFGAGFEVINIATGRQDQQEEAEAAFVFNSWKDRLQEIYPEVHFVRMTKVEEGINEYLGSHPADLVLVFPKKHNILEFHKSHAKKIAFSSSIPVMSIHA